VRVPDRRYRRFETQPPRTSAGHRSSTSSTECAFGSAVSRSHLECTSASRRSVRLRHPSRRSPGAPVPSGYGCSLPSHTANTT